MIKDIINTGTWIIVKKQPVYCIKAWNVSIHYFSKLFLIKLFIFSKLLQYTNYVSKNNVIDAAKKQKDQRVFNLKTIRMDVEQTQTELNNTYCGFNQA